MSQPTSARRSRTTALLVLLWVGWVLVPLGLAAAAVASVLTFFGDSPTAAEEAAANRYLLGAVLVAIAIPFAGLLVSAWNDRRASAVAFSLALAVGLVLAVPVLHTVAPDPAPSAIPPHSGGACQEHSGGDNRCPGG